MSVAYGETYAVTAQPTIEGCQTAGDSTRATIDQTLALIEREELQGARCGAVRVSLLSSVWLTLDA